MPTSDSCNRCILTRSYQIHFLTDLFLGILFSFLYSLTINTSMATFNLSFTVTPGTCTGMNFNLHMQIVFLKLLWIYLFKNWGRGREELGNLLSKVVYYKMYTVTNIQLRL